MAKEPASKTEAQAKTTQPTKKSRLIALLSRKSGTTVMHASEQFRWQQHTTRAAITGLRKAGFEIDACKPDGGNTNTYRILNRPNERAVPTTGSQ